ncbi:MAG: urease accessory protein, partial [Bacteroidota bacterium]
LFAAFIGFSHAFEADHLVAVSSIVTKRERTILAMKDGVFWGLGHTSTIVIIGLLMIIGKFTFLNGYFSYFEAAVGVMLIVLGVFRLYQYFKNQKHLHDLIDGKDNHHLAYGVGLVHGLAGSGAMILLVMSEIQGGFNSIIYLLIFGLGSVLGMLVAAGILSLPFSKKITNNQALQLVLIILSSLLCIGYGTYVFIENIV